MKNKSVMLRYYFFATLFIIVALGIVSRLVYIQFSEGETYRKLAQDMTLKKFIVWPERGDLYSDNGSLLATSITRFDIRFDTQSVSKRIFNKNYKLLCDSLSDMFGRSKDFYIKKIKKSHIQKNRYLLIARNLSYSQYVRIKQFPIFSMGTYKGGFIVESKTTRELPLNNIARRSIGYERIDEQGHRTRVGMEGAFGRYLEGKQGVQIRQRIANGRWKPINDINQINPKDGNDVVSTIDINMQDITHQALLKQLKRFNANHGCAIIMEVESGEIKAISNLGRNSKNGNYYEKLNYAIGESQEPGSTFKLMSLVTALEDKVIDTTTMINTGKGVTKFYDKYVRDSKRGGHGIISVAEAFKVSSNVAFAKIIVNSYNKRPEKFVNKLYDMGLNDRLGIPIYGEGKPYIPNPKDKKKWYGTTLPWMAFGYGVSLTPMQTLTFYNAIVNDGLLVKPRLLSAIKKWNITKKDFTRKTDYVRICSSKTSKKVKSLMRQVVSSPHGTGHSLRSNKIAIAGKTGTSQKNYSLGHTKIQYLSSFAGYFPADNPKYSYIVVISEPDKSINYYGAAVAGPVAKEIAEKIYLSIPDAYVVKNLEVCGDKIKNSYKKYFKISQKYQTIIPDLTNMPLMDATSILENMGLKVKVIGRGRVKWQSLSPGTKVKKHRNITLNLS